MLSPRTKSTGLVRNSSHAKQTSTLQIWLLSFPLKEISKSAESVNLVLFPSVTVFGNNLKCTVLIKHCWKHSTAANEATCFSSYWEELKGKKRKEDKLLFKGIIVFWKDEVILPAMAIWSKMMESLRFYLGPPSALSFCVSLIRWLERPPEKFLLYSL
jgi:hypothetical protein